MTEPTSFEEYVAMVARGDDAEEAARRLSLGGSEAIRALLDVLDGRTRLPTPPDGRDGAERLQWALISVGRVDIAPLLDALWEQGGGTSLLWAIGHAGPGVNSAQLARASRGEPEAVRWCVAQAQRVLAGPVWLTSQPTGRQVLARQAAEYIIARLGGG